MPRERSGAEDPPGGEQPVSQQERRAHDADHHDGEWRRFDERADPDDARDDEHRIGHGADHDDGHDDPLAAVDAGAQDEGVLRPDRDDQRQAGEEAEKSGKEVHGFTVGRQREIRTAKDTQDP